MLLSLLSVTSLLSTAYLVHRQPPAVTGIPPLDAWARPPTPHPTRVPSQLSLAEDEAFAARNAGRRQRRSSFSYEERNSPLELYLPYLNLGLGAVLVMMGWVTGQKGGYAGWAGISYLPLLIYAAVLISKVVMASVDPEKELSALKYEYRGA